jgi:hypothetical protein
MPRPAMTPELARAAAADAANRQMRAAGRKAWSEDDYTLACATFERLWPLECEFQYIASGNLKNSYCNDAMA